MSCAPPNSNAQRITKHHAKGQFPESGLDRTRLLNYYNWIALASVPTVMAAPASFLMSVVRRRVPRRITVRTPIGPVEIALRSFPSLRFVFSIFCRGDYKTPTDRPYSFIDIGANVGVAALYFLSRHPANEVICFEPDDENFSFLRQNLAPFASRATLVQKGVSVADGEAEFFRSADGDLSSLATIASPVARTRVETVSFRSLLERSTTLSADTIVKLDVEGLEEQLVASVDFADFPRVKRVFCDSMQCSRLIFRPHRRILRNGYAEDIIFRDV